MPARSEDVSTWTACEGFDSSWRNSHHSPEFYGEDDMPTKTVLVFYPGQAPQTEQMPAGTPGMEMSWLRFRIDGYLLRAPVSGGCGGPILFTIDSRRGRENVVLPSGEIVGGTAVLVAQLPDGTRRPLSDQEISEWSEKIVSVPKEQHVYPI